MVLRSRGAARAMVAAGLAVSACVCAFVLGSASAASVPSTAEPGRSTQDIQQVPPKARASGERVIPLRPGSVAPGEADKISFVLRGVELSGASALGEAQLSGAWSASLGQTITVARLYEIVNEITARYAAAGYALSFALLPEQDVTEGQVKIAVVEGFVDDVVVSVADASAKAPGLERQVAAQAARIKASRPLKTADLERALLLLNDLPGVKARAVFSASRDVVNASTLTLSIEQDRVQGRAEINNRMSEDLGSWRAGGSLVFNGLLSGADALTLQAYSALDDEGFVFGSARFDQALGTDGLMLSVTGSYSKDLPLEGLLKSVAFEGENVSGRLELSYPLLRTRPENLTFAASLSYNDTSTETLGTPLTEDKVRTVEASLTWDVADSWSGINLVRGTLVQGLDLLDASADTSILRSRANGSAVFTTVGLYASRYQPVFDRVSLFGQVQAQAAIADPLLAVSECSYGGQTFGRGYDAGAISGDNCVEGAAELRLDHGWDGLGIQLYGFADGAWVEQKGILEPGEARAEHASSAGGGVRLFVNGAYNIGAEIAVPLRERYTKDGDGDTRAFFSASARF
jgi:hemolysin activation/secretion protein